MNAITRNANVRVKICGITNLEDAIVAADAGADLIGFIFYPSSPRYIAPARARGIVDALRERDVAPKFVGVFVNETFVQVRSLMTLTQIDLVQLHGNESVAMMRAFAPHAYKSLQPRDSDDAESLIANYHGWQNVDAPTFIVDGKPQKLPGGNGTRADWAIAAKIAREFPILLAGGLNAENVFDAVRAVQPWGVDVSSGVERAPGFKDHVKVRAFIKNAKTVDGRRMNEKLSVHRPSSSVRGFE